MAAAQVCRIEKLEEGNYESWKLNMRSILTVNDLWGYTDGSIVKDPQTPGDWDTKDQKALALIILSTSKGQIQHIKKAKTSKEAWDVLKTTHESKGPVRKVCIYRQLNRLKKDSSKNMTQYVNEFSSLADQLEEAGVTIAEDLLSIMLLGGLSADYENFTVSIVNRDTMPKFEALKQKLIEHESHLKEKGSDDTEALFSRSGSKFNNRNKKKSQPSKKYNGKCFKCNKYGHKKSDCTSGNGEQANECTEDCFLAISAALAQPKSTGQWYIDSGASKHMVNDESKFKDLQPSTVKVYTASNAYVNAQGAGRAKVKFKTNERNAGDFTLTDSLLVPDFRNNLLSVPRITDHDYVVIFRKTQAEIVRPDGSIAMVAPRKDDLYAVEEKDNGDGPKALQVNVPSKDVGVAKPVAVPQNIMMWHQRLGHLNIADMNKLSNEGLTKDHFNVKANKLDCETCHKAKIHQLPYKTSAERAKEKLELVHSDICGPMRTASKQGAKYFVTFIDDKTRFVHVEFLKAKSEVFEAFMKFKSLAENASGCKIKTLRTDNAKEYLSKKFNDELSKCGIRHETSTERTPQQNGSSERFNRTLEEMARCMMVESGLPASMWAEAVNTACYIRNRCPTRALPNMTPFEAWTGRKPYTKHLRRFGCKAVFLDKGANPGKFEAKGKSVILVGYSTESKAYRLWIPGSSKVVKSRDVLFLEQQMYKEETLGEELCQLPLDLAQSVRASSSPIAVVPGNSPTGGSPDPDTGDANSSPSDPAEVTPIVETPVAPKRGRGRPRNIATESSTKQATDDSPKGKELGTRVSQRNRKPKECTCCNLAADAECESSKSQTEIPRTAEEAMDSEEAPMYKSAMDTEIENFRRNKAYILVKRTPDMTVYRGMWVYDKKLDEQGNVQRYKARYVARGYSQTPGADFQGSYSPVIRKPSIRLLLALAVERDWEVHHIDVNCAYLQSEISEDVYVEQPECFVEPGKEDYVWKLQKSIYGLKQSGKNWNDHINQVLLNKGLTRSEHDPCIYFNREEELYVGLYVDDKLVIGKPESIRTFKKSLAEDVDMKDLGIAKRFININIERSKDGSISLHQTPYIMELLKSMGMDECRGLSTPLNVRKKDIVEKDYPVKKMTPQTYRHITGSVLYLANCTRPDLAYAASYLSKFNDKSEHEHWVQAKHVLRYLKQTAGYKLNFRKTGKPLEIYVDADFASDADRISWSGLMINLADGAIDWRAKKQKYVTSSTMEAEIVSASEGSKEVMWLKWLMQEIGAEDLVAHPTVVHMDNQPAINLAENPVVTDGSKAIEIADRMVKKWVDRGEIKVEYVQSKNNLADICTKALPGIKVAEINSQIGLRLNE